MPARFTDRLTYLKLSFRPPSNQTPTFRIRLIQTGDSKNAPPLAEFLIANPLREEKRK
jgi:hypothetical protein